MTPTGRPPSFRKWLVELRRSAWVPMTVSVLLTLLMLAFGRTTRLDRVAVVFLTNTIVAFAIGTAVMFGFAMILPRIRKPGQPLPLRLLLEGLAILAATVVGTEIAVRTIAVVVPSANFVRIEALKVALPITFTATIVTIALDRAKEGRAQATERSEIAEQERLRAELVALKARVQPHFLFNSLNTVASLIEEDPKAAERAVLELAALFRYTLDASAAASVPLRQEVEAIRRYLRFEQLRFEERLTVEVEIAPEAEEVRVPPLLLQPLVENAVVHGVSTRKEGGRVRVTARIAGDAVEIAIDDDGPGPRAEGDATSIESDGPRTGSGTAVRDLTRRLALSYDGAAKLETGRGALGGYSARLVLPIRGPVEPAPPAPPAPKRDGS
jgi:two-component system sensor histidine kinase AlgZ